MVVWTVHVVCGKNSNQTLPLVHLSVLRHTGVVTITLETLWVDIPSTTTGLFPSSLMSTVLFVSGEALASLNASSYSYSMYTAFWRIKDTMCTFNSTVSTLYAYALVQVHFKFDKCVISKFLSPPYTQIQYHNYWLWGLGWSECSTINQCGRV